MPIAYFFVPPPQSTGPTRLADTGRSILKLYGAVLVRPGQVEMLDERLADVDVVPPERRWLPCWAPSSLALGNACSIR